MIGLPPGKIPSAGSPWPARFWIQYLRGCTRELRMEKKSNSDDRAKSKFKTLGDPLTVAALLFTSSSVGAVGRKIRPGCWQLQRKAQPWRRGRELSCPAAEVPPSLLEAVPWCCVWFETDRRIVLRLFSTGLWRMCRTIVP